MIITEKKPIAEILEGLKGSKKIFLVGCGECSTTCKTGGEPELKEMREELEKNGMTVVGSCIPNAPCVASQMKTEYAKNMKVLREADTVLVLACGLGVQSAKDNDRLKLEIIPALNTICGAVMDAQGNFYEKCSMCGECVLSDTAGICPITLCPKGLLNGPCGGMDKGKCEVDKDKDCAWVLIYNELQNKKRQDTFRKIRAPKDFKKSGKPHRIVMAGNA